MDIFSYFIYVLIFVLNSRLVSQPKRDFTLILNILKITVVLNYTKSHIL